PVGGDALTVPGRGEQPVDDLLVRVGRRVGEERVDLGYRRGETRQREGDAAEQRLARGLVRRLEAEAGEPRVDEVVDGVEWADTRWQVGAGGGDLGPLGRRERPVRLPLGALGDPADE